MCIHNPRGPGVIMLLKIIVTSVSVKFVHVNKEGPHMELFHHSTLVLAVRQFPGLVSGITK